MNWLICQDGWVWILGLATLAFAIRFAMERAWLGATVFVIAGVLQFMFRSEIRIFFDAIGRWVSSALRVI